MDTPEENQASKETITPDDLYRIFIRAVDEHGKWGTVNCRDATDLQFDTWARSRMPIQGEDEPWGLAERADFCNTLYQAGALHMIKRDVEIEDE